jgi:hypothetical protein
MAPSLSVSSLFQYGIIAVLAYIFVGAPILRVFSGKSFENASHGGQYPDDDNMSGYDASQLRSEKFKDMVIPNWELEELCPKHVFEDVMVFSRRPLVVYIKGFVRKREAKELIDIRYVSIIFFFPPPLVICIWFTHF